MKIMIKSFYEHVDANAARKKWGTSGYKFFKETRSIILESKDTILKQFKSIFPFAVLSKDRASLFELVLLVCMHEVSISVKGRYAYLNSVLTLKLECTDQMIVLDPEDGSFILESKFLIKICSTDRIYENIRNWLKCAINHNSLSSLVALNGEMTMSRYRKNIKTRDVFINTCCDDTAIPSFDNESLKTIFLSEDKLFNYYDIDAIFGLATISECVGFKKNINLNYTRSNHFRICNHSKFITVDGFIKPIKDCFSISIGYIKLGDNNILSIYILFNYVLNSLANSQAENYQILFEKRLLERIKELFKSNFPSYRSKTLYIDDDEQALNCITTGEELSIILNSIQIQDDGLPPFTLYYECYGLKDVFASDNYEDLCEKLWENFDLRLLQPDLDVCCNVGIKYESNYTLLFPLNFINGAISSSSYNLFMSKSIVNYNECQLKLSKYVDKTSDKKLTMLSVRTNGVKKLNVYTPVVSLILEGSIKHMNMPGNSALRLYTKFFNNEKNKRHLNKIETLDNTLIKAMKKLKNIGNYRVLGRFEVTVSSIHLPFMKRFFKKQIEDRKYYYCDTKKLYDYILNGFIIFKNLLSESSNATLESIAELSLYEILFLEFFVRGGKNLHILPGHFKYFIEENTVVGGFGDYRAFSNFQLSNDDITFICTKLTECITGASYEKKRKILKILIEFNGLVKLPQMCQRIIDEFIKDIGNLYGIENKLLLEMQSKSPQAFPIGDICSFDDVVKQYFIDEENIFSYLVYRAMYGLCCNKKNELDVVS